MVVAHVMHGMTKVYQCKRHIWYMDTLTTSDSIRVIDLGNRAPID